MGNTNMVTGNMGLSTEGGVIKIALSNLQPFEKHVFKLKSEEELGQMRDSIKEMGVIQPIIVRPTAIQEKYEIICGHSRVKAAQQAGLQEIDSIIREMSDDEAVILAIETNIAQRSFKNWLHSERAKSIFQYHEVIKKPGKRTDLESKLISGGNRPGSESARSRRKTALAYGESESTIKLYLALNKLTDGLMGRLDAKEFGTTVAYEFSLVNESAQLLLDEVLDEDESDEKTVMTVVHAKKLREMLTTCSSEERSGLDRESIKVKIRKILASDDLSESQKIKAGYIAIKLPAGQYNNFFQDVPEEEAVKMTIAALQHYIEWQFEQSNTNVST